MGEENCALCGGEMVEEEIEEEREEKLRENSDLDGDDVHALVCQDCGHVSYRRS